ncbi:MAG: ATP-binding protein [Clostridia bacterium]|nr:ATP-binding protein [Clostridia bacterium]
MITKELTYKKAFEIKNNALKEKNARRNMLLNAAYSTNPRLLEIDNEISAIGAQLAITALSGNSEKVAVLRAKSVALSKEKSAILKKEMVADIEYDCPICKDSGYVDGKICECVKKIAASVIVGELKKQMPLESCTFESFNLNYYSKDGENARKRMTSILKLCKEYVNSFDPKSSDNLLFMGAPGLGKTHLTLAIVSGVVDKGFLPFYGPAENLFALVSSERFSGENKGSYQAMLDCDLLVIDDLGTEFLNEFSKSIFYNLINTRLLSKKPTIINTNLTMKEIADRYGERIASRLIGGYNANKFIGMDIRQQKFLEENRGI